MAKTRYSSSCCRA